MKKWPIFCMGAGILLAISPFIWKPVPQPDAWMLRQIESDFACFARQKGLSKKRVAEAARDPANEGALLVLFSIRKNKVSIDHQIPPSHPQAKECLYPRIRAIQNSLQKVLKKYPLPDMDFIVSIHDALTVPFEIPVFVMAKISGFAHQILIPDFEALRGRYQVLASQDITKEDAIPSWEEKAARLIWRGGPGQHAPSSGIASLVPDDPNCFSRIKLCDLSLKNPGQIDAKFSYTDERYNSLDNYMGRFIPYEEQIQYKYQMQIDGYSCAYSTSGWKLFANSLLFKEDSNHIQWYSQELKPYEHYIPVKEGLSDLLAQIDWAIGHDREAEEIARRARAFALSHITEEKNRLYLYHALLAYSRLPWSD